MQVDGQNMLFFFVFLTSVQSISKPFYLCVFNRKTLLKFELEDGVDFSDLKTACQLVVTIFLGLNNVYHTRRQSTRTEVAGILTCRIPLIPLI